MPELILYLLKVNAALVLFYLAYHFVLRRLTFYTLNRLFLVFGLVFSTLYPFIDLPALFNRHQELALVSTYVGTIPAWAVNPGMPAQAQGFDYWQIPVFLFWLGSVVMAVRLLLQFASLYKIHSASAPARYKGTPYRQTQDITEAFSFWQTIYLNPEQHRREELDAILQHELTHVQGWHTLDVLLAELSTVFCWFNPSMWLLKKALKENLEFIADRQVISAGADRKAYQYLLLKVTGTPEPQIANQFNFPSLKRRIIMMNKIPTNNANRLRLLVALPIAAVLLFAFRAPEPLSYNDVPVQTNTTAITQDSVVYYVDGVKSAGDAYKQLNPNEIHSVNVFKGEGVRKLLSENKHAKSLVSITTKKNQNAAEVIAFNKKLAAELPTKPGTQVNVKQQQELPTPPPPSQKQNLDEPYVFMLDEVQYYKNKENWPADYSNFLKRNPSVEKIGWKFNNRREYELTSFIVYLKNGSTEVYDYNKDSQPKAAVAKYGELPQLPPPPPPTAN